VKRVAPLPVKKGKSRQLAAVGSGRSGVSLEKGCKVVEAADKLRKEGDAKTADELLAKLNKAYTPALAYAKALGLIKQTNAKNKPAAETKKPSAPGKATGSAQTPVPAVLLTADTETAPIPPANRLTHARS
jgi:hypothetical protein